jgi:hypothetical protein
MKKGGRVKMEDGGISERYTTDEDMDAEHDMDTAELDQGTNLNKADFVAQQASEIQQPKTQQLSANQIQPLGYEELRSRLPKEISNDVVLLVSKSQQAFVDFANITTQKDVVDFNAKYGVNLVLPQV